MTSSYYLTYIGTPLFITGTVLGSLIIYKYAYKHSSNKYTKMELSNKKNNVQQPTRQLSRIIKTKSSHNLHLRTTNEPSYYYKLVNKILELDINNPDYIYLRVIIQNSHLSNKKCSNPNCRNIIDTDGCIYNAFDVQYCSQECRNISSQHVLHYWI